ncbi:MAG: HEAT repeat domain-containing protein [Pseudomonadota bacterium]
MPQTYHDQRPSSGNGTAVFLGILVSQFAATLLVRSANVDLHKEMTAIIAKGYVAVPSPGVVKDLAGWFSAFMGGIFFTVTLGFLLILLSLSLVRLVQRTQWSFSRRVAVLAAVWAILTIFVNSAGLNSGATLYVSAVVVTVFITSVAGQRTLDRKERRLGRAFIVFAPLILLAGLWMTRLDTDLFVDIRDRLLFSNPVGIKVVEFYYDYTLYGAQAMAPLSQHTMIGVDLSALKDDEDYRGLADALRQRDALDIGEAPSASAVLTPEGEGIRWQDATGRTLTVSRKDILEHPDVVVKQFSDTADRNGPFRLLTLAGIFIGFPVMLYLVLFAVIEGLLRYIAGRNAAIITALVCLSTGAALFYPLAAAPKIDFENTSAFDLWREGSPAARIMVLKQAVQKGIDPLRYQDADALSQSAGLAERYWFARSLAGNRSDRGFELLGRMMNDPSPLVLCQVCYAFGEMNNPAVVPVLLRYIKNGGYWYAQRYAYAALRKLGWLQEARYR